MPGKPALAVALEPHSDGFADSLAHFRAVPGAGTYVCQIVAVGPLGAGWIIDFKLEFLSRGAKLKIVVITKRHTQGNAGAAKPAEQAAGGPTVWFMPNLSSPRHPVEYSAQCMFGSWQ